MQGNCAIELKLDECLGRLIAHAKPVPVSSSTNAVRLSSHGSQSTAPKVLSWLNLPALPAFTASVQSFSDCAKAPDAAPPLSSYAHDDALLEVAKHGSKGAQIVTQPIDEAEDDFGGNDAEPLQDDAMGSSGTATSLAAQGSPSIHRRKHTRPGAKESQKYASLNERSASLRVDCNIHTNGASSTH